MFKNKLDTSNAWISIDDRLPYQSDQYLVAYIPLNQPNEKAELDYCTAHFDKDENKWHVKDQLFYRQRQCKVIFWRPLPTLQVDCLGVSNAKVE